MAEVSSYLRYLPPVLWADEPPPSELSLGAFLRIFEKMLTGIDDGVAIRHGDHDHEPVTAVVDRLAELFDPWRAPAEFLPWLASWVDLSFPTLQGQPLWDEYQRRKATAEMARIHRLRGLRAGLRGYLDLYAVGPAQPRVVLDDGNRLLITTPRPGPPAPLTALVSRGPVLVDRAVRAEGLIRPWCLAPAPDGGLFVGDIGVPASVPLPLRSRVWHLDATGRLDVAGIPPRPQPLAPDSLPLTQVVAVAVAPAGTLYVLDRPGKLYALPAPYSGPATLVTSLVSGATTLRPVAMAADPGGDLLVLDRGDGPGTPNPPKIITVRPGPPVNVTRTPLRTVREPLSLLVRPDRRLVVGDGGEQEPAGPEQHPGNLVLVDRTTATWTERALLPAANPLTAPTALVLAGTTLYVLDVGLKPFAPSPADPFVPVVARPAMVHRVDLSTDPPLVSPATESGQLVFPTGMTTLGAQLVICDPGQPDVAGLTPVWTRLLPYRFGVVVHFTQDRLPADPQQRVAVQRRVVGDIRTVVDQQRPAHTRWQLVTAI